VPTNRSSRLRRSRLIELFSVRAGDSSSDPSLALKRLLVELRKAVGWSRKSPQLERAQLRRRIFRVEYKVSWDRDGCLEPLGTSFDQGFRLTLNAKSSKNRVRFTQAHELCHTFFYEYVPEIKFRPHLEDPAEEYLCNFGAAELLMPEYSLRKETKVLPRSIQSLLRLASDYNVSPEAMMARLRSLRLWNGELHIWRREAGDDFVLDRIVGAKWLPWKWSDRRVPVDAWTKRNSSGHSYLECSARPGYRQFKSIAFDAVREGSTLMVLSGVSEPFQREAPLFLHVP
jgi:Zn-dependent peptidase ImmA (M78 family)